MSSTYADLIVRLRNARQAKRDAQQVAGGVRQIGAAAAFAGNASRAAGSQIGGSLRSLGTDAKYGALGVGLLGAAGAKMGLQFNAQVESARQRFRLFTDDVDGLTTAVKGIDARSQFNFGDLADAAAMLGNSNVRDIPKVLLAAANAAAASGRGTPALQSIVIALSQIQAKGKLSQEEINQLNEAGAPGAQKTIQRAFGLTAKQVGNLGGQGLNATKAIQALTKEWTSGRMASAAERQLHTLGGQWDLFTGNVQKLSGAATAGLSAGLEHNVLPAANRAVGAITDIFGKKGLSDTQKLQQARDVIRRELGPIAQDLIHDIQDAHLADKLDNEFELAMGKITTTAVHEAPHVVSRFVDAWLGAGPWAKLVSGAWVAKKLGLGPGILAALKTLGGKGGKSAGGAAAAFGGRGSIPERPLYVWQVGTGMASAIGDRPGNRPSGPNSRRQRAGSLAGAAARAVGFYDVLKGADSLLKGNNVGKAIDDADPTNALHAVGLPSLHEVGGRYSGLKGWRNLMHDLFSGPGTGPQPVAVDGAIAPPGFGTPLTPQRAIPRPVQAQPVVVNRTIKLLLDRKVLATAFDQEVSDVKARR